MAKMKIHINISGKAFKNTYLHTADPKFMSVVICRLFHYANKIQYLRIKI
jgi:hypothetical protein